MPSPAFEKEVSLAVTQSRAAWLGSSCVGKALDVLVGSELSMAAARANRIQGCISRSTASR